MKPLILAALGALLAFPTYAQSQDPSGTWLSQSGETRVRIARCGAALCGTIVSVKTDAKDVDNPDPAKRERSLVGVQMISDIKPAGDGFTGQLYNYQDGKTYSGKMKLVGPTVMELSGCVMSIFCKTQTWTRVN